MLARRCLLALLAVLMAACTTPKTPSSGGAPATARARRNPDVISREELEDPTIAGTDAETAIRQLRPAFFRTRGPQSLTNATAGLVQISQDFGPLQPLSQLSAVDTRSLTQVRYLSAVDAQSRFGITANGGPVILLLTTRQ
jgi:hypothetical protein